MRRYTLAYLAWLITVALAAVAAAAWYRYVEQIGWRELAKRTGGDDGEG